MVILDKFEIYPVPIGSGLVALAPIPGRHGDYAGDLGTLLEWRPDLVISMTTDIEMADARVSGLGHDLQCNSVKWVHLPIEDFGAPSSGSQTEWSEVSAAARRILSGGGKVLVHCRGGCGRSGMTVLRLMVESGENPEQALRRLRAARPCAVETAAQLAWATAPVPRGV